VVSTQLINLYTPQLLYSYNQVQAKPLFSTYCGGACIFSYCAIQANSKKRYKLKVDSFGKNKKDKIKRGKNKNIYIFVKTESFELCPECHLLLIFARLAGALRIVFDEPGEVFSVVDFLTEHLFAANGKEGLALVGSYRLVLL